jgi:hypothetical protein
MGEHDCLHESDWAVMQDHVHSIGKDLKDVIKLLRGNGEHGIITKLALQKQCIDKLHERLDTIENDMRAIRNKTWGVITVVAITIVVSVIKIAFFGG